MDPKVVALVQNLPGLIVAGQAIFETFRNMIAKAREAGADVPADDVAIAKFYQDAVAGEANAVALVDRLSKL
jgi:hypothetical protein